MKPTRPIPLTPRGRRLINLARTFRNAYAEWRKLTPNDRAAVSRLSGLFIGNIRRS